MSSTLNGENGDFGSVKGTHGRGISLLVKRCRLEAEPVGRPGDARWYSSGDILAQDAPGVVVYCERFDTNRGRPFERPQKSDA